MSPSKKPARKSSRGSPSPPKPKAKFPSKPRTLGRRTGIAFDDRLEVQPGSILPDLDKVFDNVETPTEAIVLSPKSKLARKRPTEAEEREQVLRQARERRRNTRSRTVVPGDAGGGGPLETDEDSNDADSVVASYKGTIGKLASKTLGNLRRREQKRVTGSDSPSVLSEVTTEPPTPIPTPQQQTLEDVVPSPDERSPQQESPILPDIDDEIEVEEAEEQLEKTVERGRDPTRSENGVPATIAEDPPEAGDMEEEISPEKNGVASPPADNDDDGPLSQPQDPDEEIEKGLETPQPPRTPSPKSRSKSKSKSKSIRKLSPKDPSPDVHFGLGGNDSSMDLDDIPDGGDAPVNSPEPTVDVNPPSPSPSPPKPKIQRGRKKKKKSITPEQSPPMPVDDDDDKKKSKKKKTKRSKKKQAAPVTPQGIPAGNHDYEHIPISKFRPYHDEDDTPPGVRRSQRARCAPLEWWRGEKQVYGPNHEEGLLGEAMGHMPVVKEIQTALPTPYKQRKTVRRRPADADDDDDDARKKKKRKGAEAARRDLSPPPTPPEKRPFDTVALLRKHDYIDGDSTLLWDEENQEAAQMKVISYSLDTVLTQLPIPSTRPARDGKVTGKAAQAFNFVGEPQSQFAGYMMGNLVLPPRGIKDHENVGLHSQTFTVLSCQPMSLEFALTHGEGKNELHRFLLSPGDMFRIPPGNGYFLKNHSRLCDATMTWNIIKPFMTAVGNNNNNEEDEETDEE